LTPFESFSASETDNYQQLLII